MSFLNKVEEIEFIDANKENEIPNDDQMALLFVEDMDNKYFL